MTLGYDNSAALPLGCAAAKPRHLRRHSGFISKDHALRIEIGLTVEPDLSPGLGRRGAIVSPHAPSFLARDSALGEDVLNLRRCHPKSMVLGQSLGNLMQPGILFVSHQAESEPFVEVKLRASQLPLPARAKIPRRPPLPVPEPYRCNPDRKPSRRCPYRKPASEDPNCMHTPYPPPVISRDTESCVTAFEDPLQRPRFHENRSNLFVRRLNAISITWETLAMRCHGTA